MTMIRWIVGAVCLVSLVAVAVRAQEPPPPTVALDGAAAIPLAAQARRAHLLGDVELYSLAVYLDGSVHDRPQLLSSGVPKALRIEITHKDELGQRSAVDWRRELVPHLEPAGAAHLWGSFASLRYGGVVLIEYVPTKGTTVRVNRGVAVSGAAHDLMLAFLDHWLGQRPVSEEIKRSLLGAS